MKLACTVSKTTSQRSRGLVIREREGDGALVGVEDHEERVIDDPLAARPAVVDRVAGELHGQGPNARRLPLLVGHLGAVGREPGEVLDARAADLAALEELAAAKHRVGLEAAGSASG